MGLFSKTEKVADDYLPTRKPLTVHISNPSNRKYYVQGLAKADPLISSVVPESEIVLSMFLYESFEFLILTQKRLLHIGTSKVKREMPLDKITKASSYSTENVHRLIVEGNIGKYGNDVFHIQYGTRGNSLEGATQFANDINFACAALG